MIRHSLYKHKYFLLFYSCVTVLSIINTQVCNCRTSVYIHNVGMVNVMSAIVHVLYMHKVITSNLQL